MTNPQADKWREIGDTTAGVYKAEFTRKGSPLLAYADELWESARPHSALALAHMAKENQYSTTGILIKPEHNNPMALRHPNLGMFMVFDSPVDCVKEWQRRINDPTYKGGVYTKTTTLSEYLGVYAPPGDVHPVTGLDNADIDYLGSVRDFLARYAELEDNSMAYTPKQYFNWWLHEGKTVDGVWYPAVHKYNANRNGNKPQAIVHHIQEGWNKGSWQHFHVVSASSTVLIARNGDIWWLVPEQHGPWTNGDVANPDTYVRAMMNANGPNPNNWSLTIEYEGFTGNLPYTEEQYQSGLWLTREWMRKYPQISVDDNLRHGQINSVSRYYCCEGPNGKFMPRLKADLRSGAVGVIESPYEAGQTVKFTENLNLREGPGLAGKFVKVMPAGTVASLIDAKPITKDGYTYYDVSIDGFGTGFVIDSFETVLAPPPPAVDTRKTFTTRFELPLRVEPGFNGEIVAELAVGEKGKVISGPEQKDGIGWYKVETSDHGTGYLPASIMHTLSIK